VKATRTLRRASQWVVFLLFAFLFLNTEYKDNDVLPYAVNLFLRLDPLMAGAATLAGRAVIGLVWPALVVALLTVALGRFFCGWFCPLGAVIDAADATVFRNVRPKDAVPGSWRRYKFLVLFFLAASSLFTLAFEQPVFRTSAAIGLLFLGILPWAGHSDCIVCEEHCPTWSKAIVFREERTRTARGDWKLFKKPYIDEDLCVGCGICETKCPLADRAAVLVTSRGETRSTGVLAK